MGLKQIRVGNNFSYVVYCGNTEKGALVDPTYDASAALEFISSNNLKLEFLIATHHHSDHTGDISRVKKKYSCEVIALAAGGSPLLGGVDKVVKDGETLQLGDIKLKFIHTPGHTPDGLCILVDNEALLTGDTLFIGDCGRCDLPGSNIAQMFRSLQDKIKTLPDHLIVYPGHDYGDKPYDTLGNQKKTNKTLLAKNLEEFSKLP